MPKSPTWQATPETKRPGVSRSPRCFIRGEMGLARFGVNPSARYLKLESARLMRGVGKESELTKPDLRGSPLCVVTVLLGKGAEGLELQSLPMLRAYAAKCSADFRVITDLGEGDKYQHPKYAVMQIGDFYDNHGYERILYIDADVLVKPDAPDMFQTFKPGRFYARNEQAFKPDGWALQYHNRVCEWTQTAHPFDGIHFNGGVQLSDRAHRVMYTMPPWDVTAPDRVWYGTRVVKNQPWFNWLRMEHGIPYGEIGPEWNALMSDFDRERDMGQRAHFWHFATAPHLFKMDCANRRMNRRAFDPRRVCVVSVCVGDAANDCANTSEPAQRDWAHRHGYDFHMFTETGDHISPAWTRLDAVPMLDRYDLVVYLDNDVVPKPSAPNLAWCLPAGDGWDIAAFDSGAELDYMRGAGAREVAAYCADTGQTMPSGYGGETYINSGGLVFNRTDRMRAFRCAESTVGYQDQNALALAVARGDLAVWRLPRAWNFGHFHKAENLEKAETDTGVFFAHWTGVPYTKGRAQSMARFSRKLHEARA
mgnify:FL=1